MSYQPGLQEVTSKDYQVKQCVISGSSVRHGDISEISDSLFFSLTRQRLLEKLILYHMTLPEFEIDLSSVMPRFEPKNETFLTRKEVISDELLVTKMLKHDFILRIPAKSRIVLRARIKAVRNASPRVIGPEEPQ